RWVVAALDRLEQIAGVVIGVHRYQRVGLGVGQVRDALIGDEVVADPDSLPGGVDPHEGVAAVEVHVPPAARDTAIPHQPGDLMHRLRRERPKVHCMSWSRRLLSARRFCERMKLGNFNGSRRKNTGVSLPTMS